MLAEAKPAPPQTGKKQAGPRSPHGGQEIFATPAIHSPVPSTPASSVVSGEQGSQSRLPAEETSDVSSGSDKAVLKHTAKKSRQIPALAHDIELRNRKILMDQQNKVITQLSFSQYINKSFGSNARGCLA